MTEREPLVGWRLCDGVEVRLHGPNLAITVSPGGRWVVDLHSFRRYGYGEPLRGWKGTAQLSAEDAARALVREMAAALGMGVQAEPCRWTPTDGGAMYSGCGSEFAIADTWMTYCPVCGGRVVVDEREGVSDG